MLDLSRYLEQIGPLDPWIMPIEHARRAAHASRQANGFADYPGLLTLPGDNQKLSKGDVPNSALSLAQDTTSGLAQACRHSTPGCRAVCVAKNGNGSYNSVVRGRRWRVQFLLENPLAFVTLWAHELGRFRDKYAHVDGVDCVGHRPNAFSDVRWERIVPDLFTIEGIQFYDYTKWPSHQRTALPNYRLTYSYTGERNRSFPTEGNVAVVFDTKKGQALPATWSGMHVIDGDETDNRYDDPVGVVVGLRAKGRARRDTTGFVVQTKEAN